MKQAIIRFSIVFVIGVIIGILLFNHFRSRPKPCATIEKQPDVLLAKLAETEAQYNVRLDSLNLANSILQRTVLKTQSTLVQVKAQNRQLHQTVDDLLSVHDTTTDTIAKLENCDSLAVTVHELLVLDSAKEQLYDIITDGYRQEVALRDSMIVIKDIQYDSLQVSYANTLEEQKALVKENAEQRKEIKQQKKRKGIITAILVAIGSLFAYSTLK
jgi:hypothetical protein